MANMMRWDPFQDLRSAQDEMAQMSPMLAHALGLHTQQGNARAATTAWAPALGISGRKGADLGGRTKEGIAGPAPTAWAPALDISERKDAYLVMVELPGVEADDLDITLEDGLLTIQGERHFAHDS